MTTDPKERILEACIEEVLANHSPPDLTARIMQSLDSQGTAANGNGSTQQIPFARPIAGQVADAPTAQVVSQQPSVQVSPARRQRKRRQTTWLNVMMAAGILGIGITVGIVALNSALQNDKPLEVVKPDTNNSTTDDNPPKPNSPSDDPPRIARDNFVKSDDSSKNDDRGKFPDVPTFVHSEPTPPKFERPERSLPAPSAHNDIVAAINTHLKKNWDAASVEPAGPTDDADWCNRAFQRILGRRATDAEIDRFVKNDYPDKKVRLVDQLVSGESYATEYADYWASVWSDSLIGPTGGTRKGDLANRDGLLAYLRDAIKENKPYDQVAFELISATGSSRPGTADFNGATNFMLALMDDKAKLATGHTARVFMDSQLQCAQCHDHADNQQLAQKSFWEFNSFLRQMEFQRDPQSGNVRLVNIDFVGEGDDAQDAIVYYENADGELKAVGPAFQGESLSANGLISEVDRRTELAERIVATDKFALTATNRIWTHFLTYGLSEKVTEAEANGPHSDAALLNQLGAQFAAHKYNMKDLIRWVALSDAFGLATQDIGLDAQDLPEIGDRPLFTRYYKRLESQPVATALASAAKALADGGLADWKQLQVLGKRLDTSANPEIFVPVMPTVISKQDQQFIYQMAVSEKLTRDQKVQHLFMAAVSRTPRGNELKEINKLAVAYTDNETGALDVAGMLEVIWIVLTKSNEFALDR